MLLTEALQIPPSARCICAVGAGGKTSLLYELAEEYRQEGQRVLLTTTTKMYLPENDGVLDGTAEENWKETVLRWREAFFLKKKWVLCPKLFLMKFFRLQMWFWWRRMVLKECR